MEARILSKKYKDYIQSEAWQKKSAKKLKMSGYKCERCGVQNCVLQVHHKDYHHLGRERFKDLKVLCVPCHRFEDEQRRTKLQRLGWR